MTRFKSYPILFYIATRKTQHFILTLLEFENMNKKLSTTQVQEIVEMMASRLSSYIEECANLPSKFECYECGRASNEYFVCECHRPHVCEYKECPVCGEWIDIDDTPVWHCCMTVKVVDQSDIEDCYKNKFSELLHKIFRKARKNKPFNRSFKFQQRFIDDQMINVICDYYEDDASLKEATDFVNG